MSSSVRELMASETVSTQTASDAKWPDGQVARPSGRAVTPDAAASRRATGCQIGPAAARGPGDPIALGRARSSAAARGRFAQRLDVAQDADVDPVEQELGIHAPVELGVDRDRVVGGS